MNHYIGSMLKITFQGQINCVITGKKIKTYGEGTVFDAWKNSPLAVESIIRPELSRIHEGIALRDEMETEHHLQPHYVYLTKTAGIKAGVTRATNIPFRWIDQGAVEGLVIAETPYRQAAGLIEVALKQHISDRTNWRKMLTNDIVQDTLESTANLLMDKFLKNSKNISYIEIRPSLTFQFYIIQKK